MGAGAVYTRWPRELYARNDDVALSTTGQTTLLQWTDQVTSTYEISVSGYVANATTALTVAIQYTDAAAPSAGVQSRYIFDDDNLVVGGFDGARRIRVYGGTAVTVTATAGTAGNVTLSAEAVRS